MSSIREFFNEAGRRAWRMIYYTPVEVALGAMLIGAFGIPAAYNAQLENEGKTPVAFSEVGKTAREFERRGEKLPGLTGFYGKNSDYQMQFFEASNTALETTRAHERFAHELEFRMDPSLRVHRQIPTYAAEIPGFADEALKSVHVLDEVQQELPAIISAFDAAWSENHQNFDKTVWEDVEKCDSDGKNCHMVSESHQEYDYSIHTYTYDAAQGVRAVNLLSAFLERHPEIKIDEKLILATKTDPENEYAIEKSMKELLQGKIPTPLQALTIANTWATGSNFTTFMPVVQGNHASLHGDLPASATALKTAHSIERRTNSKTDTPPHELVVAQNAQSHAQEVYDASQKITGGIRFAAQQAPKLLGLAREYIAVVLDHKPGNPDKIRSEMMKTARHIYTSNYANGLDVETFRWGIFLLFSSLSLLTGGLLGKGVDSVLNKHRERGFPIGDLLKLETWKNLKSIKSIFTAEAPRQQPASGVTDDTPANKRPRRDFTV